MKKVQIIILLFLSILLLNSCNSREDVKHLSQKNMIKYVKDAIGEDISLVSVDGNENDSVITYLFKLDNRNVTFEATSLITAPSIDGTQFGNYEEHISIQYEEGIAESEYYKTERLRIGKELNIKDEDMEFGLAIIQVDNYKDINKVTQFAIELDKLYAFNEKNPKLIRHIDIGAISFSKNSIAGPKFSTNKNHRLEYKDVYNEIESSYIEQLKRFGDYDNTIPKNKWEKNN